LAERIGKAMWMKITLGLIGFFGALLLIIAATGNASVVLELPPGAEAPHPAWLFGWFFILIAAVIIVATTAVRLVLKAIHHLKNKRTTSVSGPWS